MSRPNYDARSRAWADRFKQHTGKRPTFDQAADYSAATHYLEAVQQAGTDKAEDVSKRLDGMKTDDFFARNATLRPQDHRLVHDAYLAKVKSPAQATEDGDYRQLVSVIPASKAFDRPSPDCHMS